MQKKTTSFLAIALLALALPLSALAADFKAGDKTLISIPFNDDLYVAGGQVKIKSKIDADLVAAGGEVDINNDISGDLIVAGGRVFIGGNVGDDIRVAGGEIDINGNVGDDLIVAGGGSVRIFEDTEISGDLIVNGGEVKIDGRVNGKLIANGGRIVLNGTIGESAEINGGLLEMNGAINGTSKIAAEEIVLGANAAFGSKVEYWTKKGKIDFGKANAVYKKELGKKFNKWDFNKKGAILGFLGFKLITVLSGALIIFLLLFGRKFFKDASQKLEKNVWKSFGFGVLYFILTPIAAILLLITVIGIPLGLLTGAMYAFSFVFACPIIAMILTCFAEKRHKKKWSKWEFFGISVGVLIALKFIAIIPILGGMVLLFVGPAVFGAFIMQKIEVCKKICK